MLGPDSRTLPRSFISPKEAAAYLGINIRTVYKFMKKPIAKGGLPYRKISATCYRIPRDKFIKWAGTED
jgi:excisionase family DNA binding protein